MRKLLAILLVLLTFGCSSPETFDLGDEWEPLIAVTERPAIFRNVGSDTAIATIGQYVYVRDMDDFLARYVPGTPKFTAAMRHEQEHSRRQLDMGTFLWLARYSYDRDFALYEEQVGYYWEVTERFRLGNPIDVVGYARAFSTYRNLSGRLISFEDARQWFSDVIAGHWTPTE